MQWDQEYNPSDMWYVVNGLTLTHLKNCISKKLNTYKSYKQCFDHIEEEWQKNPLPRWQIHQSNSQRGKRNTRMRRKLQMTHRNKHSRQRSTKYSRNMAGTTTTTNHTTIAQTATDPSITDSTQTEMTDSQATASTHPDTKAQQWPTRHTHSMAPPPTQT